MTHKTVSSYEDSRELVLQSVKRDARHCVWGNLHKFAQYDGIRKRDSLYDDLRQAAQRLRILALRKDRKEEDRKRKEEAREYARLGKERPRGL